MPARQPTTVDANWVITLVILVLSISAPAFLEDDAWYFSYLNNVLHPAPLYYVNGFVYIIPELAAYAWSFFPIAWQGPLYRVLPLLMSLVIYREYRRLFELETDRLTACALAFAAILITRVVEPDLWGDLGFLHYACYVWAVLFVVRIGRSGESLSWLAFSALLMASISFPLGVMFVPVLLWQASRLDSRAARQRQTLAVAIVVIHVAFAAWAGGIPVKVERPDQLLIAFVTHFREQKMHNLVVMTSALVLTIAAMRSLSGLRAGNGRPEPFTLWFLGIASVVAYFYSDRFRQNHAAFEPQHTVPILTCALIAIGQGTLRWRDARSRDALVGGELGFAAAIAMVALYSTLRGPLELSLMKYRFISVAADFRRHCRDDNDAMVFEDDGRSPVVLCRPRAFGPGFHPIRVPPSVGTFDPDTTDPPGITVEKPLF